MRASRAWFACLLLLPTMGCQGGEKDAQPEPAPSSKAAPGMDDSLRDAALALVETREKALRDGDRKAFLATVDPDAEDFIATQARWFDNLTELPVTDLALELGDEGVMTRVHGDGDLQLPIDFTMRLDGFDQHAATQPLIYTFVGDEDAVLLTSDRNLQSDAMTGWRPAPWDVTDIVVEQTDDVLGVFDDETDDNASAVMDATTDALAVVDAVVPAWPGHVAVYTIGDLDALDKMSLMEVSETGGVAFPVPVRPGSREVASYRVMLNPASTQTDIQRLFLLRHELTHVALGTKDDRSPEWLVEGAAEYVAGSTYSVDERRRGRAVDLDDAADPQLRRGRDFYQVEPTASYAIAGIVCDYLATTRGPQSLWDLMAAFRAVHAANAADDDAVLRRELGVDAEQLTADALAWLNG